MIGEHSTQEQQWSQQEHCHHVILIFPQLSQISGHPLMERWWQPLAFPLILTTGTTTTITTTTSITTITTTTTTIIITFCVSCRQRKMYFGHVRLCVCPRPPTLLHGPGCNLGRGRGRPLVVHYWADLQSGHGLRCYGNITRTLVTNLRPSRDMTT